MMTEWEWTHAAIGGLASVVFLFQTLGTADGDGDLDADFDSPTDTASLGGESMGLSDYLSVRNFVAFFIGYGWITFASLLSGASRAKASFLGVAAGLLFVFVSLMLLRTFLKFQEDGSLKLERLVGKSASVYIAIGARGSSQGKVLLDTQKGRVELPARSDHSEKLSPGAWVKIVSVDSGILWVTVDESPK